MDPNVCFALLMLSAIEIVLGIDNIIRADGSIRSLVFVEFFDSHLNDMVHVIIGCVDENRYVI